MTAVTAIPGDITTVEADVIVNAANRDLRPGAGVDGAIRSAGGPAITAETSLLKPIGTGEAVATTAGNLSAGHVIHAIGPIWGSVPEAEADQLLESCYSTSLHLALELGARSIAFPSISTGIYGFPMVRAAGVATGAVTAWLASNPDRIDEVIFVCFDEPSLEVYEGLLGL